MLFVTEYGVAMRRRFTLISDPAAIQARAKEIVQKYKDEIAYIRAIVQAQLKMLQASGVSIPQGSALPAGKIARQILNGDRINGQRTTQDVKNKILAMRNKIPVAGGLIPLDFKFQHSYFVQFTEQDPGYKIFLRFRAKLPEEGVFGVGSVKVVTPAVDVTHEAMGDIIADAVLEKTLGQNEIKMLTERASLFATTVVREVPYSEESPSPPATPEEFLRFVYSTERQATSWITLANSIKNKLHIFQKVPPGKDLFVYANDDYLQQLSNSNTQEELQHLEEIGLKIFYGLAFRMKELHDQDKIHRDFKPQNAYFDPETGLITLVDLETVVPLPAGKNVFVGPAVGTPMFLSRDTIFQLSQGYWQSRAPDKWRYSKASDIYALAVSITFFLLPGVDKELRQYISLCAATLSRALFDATNPLQGYNFVPLLSALARTKLTLINRPSQYKMLDLIAAMFAESPGDRPKIDKILTVIREIMLAYGVAIPVYPPAQVPVGQACTGLEAGDRPADPSVLLTQAATTAEYLQILQQALLPTAAAKQAAILTAFASTITPLQYGLTLTTEEVKKSLEFQGPPPQSMT